jgi:hypothetical protein
VKRFSAAIAVVGLLLAAYGYRYGNGLANHGSVVSLYSVLPDVPETRNKVKLIAVPPGAFASKSSGVEQALLLAIDVDWSEARLRKSGLAPKGFRNAAHFGKSVVFGGVTDTVLAKSPSQFEPAATEAVFVNKPGKTVAIAAQDHATSSKTLAAWVDGMTAVQRAVEFGAFDVTVRNAVNPAAPKWPAEANKRDFKSVAYGFTARKSRLTVIVVNVFGTERDAQAAAKDARKFFNGDVSQRIALYGSELKGWEVVVKENAEIAMFPVDASFSKDKVFGLIDFSIDRKMPD